MAGRLTQGEGLRCGLRRTDLRCPHGLGHPVENRHALAAASGRERLLRLANATADVLPVAHPRHGRRRPAIHDFLDARRTVMDGRPTPTMTRRVGTFGPRYKPGNERNQEIPRLKIRAANVARHGERTLSHAMLRVAYGSRL